MNFLYFDRLAMEMFPANCWEGEDKKNNFAMGTTTLF